MTIYQAVGEALRRSGGATGIHFGMQLQRRRKPKIIWSPQAEIFVVEGGDSPWRVQPRDLVADDWKVCYPMKSKLHRK